MNRGGIAASLQLADPNPSYRIAASVFVAGLVAFLIGAGELIENSLGAAVGYWSRVAHHGVRDEKSESETKSYDPVIWKMPSIWLSILFLVFFVCGVVTLALGYWG